MKFYFRIVITKALMIFPCSKLRWFLMQFNSHIETKSLLAESPHGSHHVFTFRKDYLGRLLTVKSSLKLATFYNRFLLYFEPNFSSFPASCLINNCIFWWKKFTLFLKFHVWIRLWRKRTIGPRWCSIGCFLRRLFTDSMRNSTIMSKDYLVEYL